jgi:hypothetical protein
VTDVNLTATDDVGVVLRSKLGFKVRHGQPGKVRPHLEKKVGDEFQYSTGRWLHLEQTVDHENDLYTEKLTDPESGEVIRDVQERLSEHRGHGAARPPR